MQAITIARTKKSTRPSTTDVRQQALYTAESPLKCESPYHAFSKSPSTTSNKGGRLTTQRLLWHETSLFGCWELEDVSASAALPEQSRVLCCFWQPSDSQPALPTDKIVHTIEMSMTGNAVHRRSRLDHDESLLLEANCTCVALQLAVGNASTSSPTPAAIGIDSGFKTVLLLDLPWASLKIDIAAPIRMTFCHSNVSIDGHCPALKESQFGELQLMPQESGLDCSCCAARLLRPQTLRLVRTPKPSLDACPPGSLLVQAKYASVCGSDMPFFKASEMRAPSSYWDRDGFCGHEVIGIVIASKSTRFSEGDPVLALPSSYFKAHASSRQEWYDAAVHGVLLEDFPVRGGFSQIFTGHELYCYRISQCVPRLLAAQGLGTILRMARKIGPVLGQSVVVVGQGQNGLMATRLFSQMCCKTLIAVEPLLYRRNLALSMGAHQAVSPENAATVIMEATGGHGADIVCEMVGHNQETINTCLEYVRCSGMVVAFGVPDDATYTFEFSKFFRKNVQLVASVIPDPGVDFPEAVQLIERGQFTTEGIFSHHLQLADVERAFTIASDYLEDVVKLVIEL